MGADRSARGFAIATLTLARPRAALNSRTLFQAGNALYWLSLYFYVPILAVYARGMGASLSLVGVMLSAYGVMQLAFRIPLGVTSDLAGRRKPFVIAGPALAALGAVGFLWAPTPWFLVGARAITGLAACAWVVITVMYSGYYPPAEATRAIGIMGLTNGLGQVIATYTGGVAADAYGWQAPFVLSLAAGAAGVALMALCREPVHDRRASAPIAGAESPWRRLWIVGTAPPLLTVSLLSAVNSYLNFSTVFGFTPVYAKQIGATPAELGLITAISLVPFTLAQPLNASLARRAGFAATVAGGLTLSGLMVAVVPLTHTFPVLVATQITGGIGRGFLSASLMSLAILAVDQRERATAMGVYQAVYSIGMFLGPLVSGVVGQQLGLAPVFISSGLLSVGAGIVAWFTLPRNGTKDN